MEQTRSKIERVRVDSGTHAGIQVPVAVLCNILLDVRVHTTLERFYRSTNAGTVDINHSLYLHLRPGYPRNPVRLQSVCPLGCEVKLGESFPRISTNAKHPGATLGSMINNTIPQIVPLVCRRSMRSL